MTKKTLLTLSTTLLLTQSVYAVGEFADGNALEQISSGDFKLGGMYDSDYDVGAIMQFGHILDLKVGIEGAGVDFHFWKMKFKTRSAYLTSHPLEFYASAGVGYRWDDGGQSDGLILRAPGGADWKFSKNGWSCYLEVGPSYNFGSANKNGFRIMSGTGIRYNF